MMGANGIKTKLRAADINKVDFVPAGAQQHSRISITKSAGGDNKISILESIVKAITGYKLVPDTASGEPEPGTFNQELNERKNDAVVDQAMDDMWDFTYALRDSIREIISCSKVASDKTELIQASLDQFCAAVESQIDNWATPMLPTDNDADNIAKIGKKISSDRMSQLKDMHQSLSNLIKGADDVSDSTDNTSDDQAAIAVENEDQGDVDKDAKAKATSNKTKPDKAEGSESDMAENKTKINKSALPQDVQDYITGLEANQIAKSADTTVTEDIYKGLPEGVAKMLKETVSKLDGANQQIAKMADENMTKEYIAKAAGFEGLGIKADEFGPVLKSIAAISPEAYSKVEAVLKAANEAVSKGGLFGEAGSGSEAGMAIGRDDAWAQIQQLADARVTKGENKTQADAITEVMKTAEGHKLYAIYTGK